MKLFYDNENNYILPDGFGVESKTGVLKDILLGSPEFFFWQPVSPMVRRSLANLEKQGIVFDKQLALEQHQGLVDAFKSAGVRVHFLAGHPDLPYGVYARDNNIMTPWGPIVSSMQPWPRRREYSLVVDFYEKANVPIWNWATRGHLEGGDIVILEPGCVLVGYSEARSEEAGANQCAEWFREKGWDVLQVLQPELFVHMDCTVVPCAEKTALVCTEVLEDYVLDFLKARGFDFLEATYKECMSLCCNVLPLGNGRIMSPAHSTRLNQKMTSLGLEVITPDLTMFTYGGGGVHCLTMELRRLAK